MEWFSVANTNPYGEKLNDWKGMSFSYFASIDHDTTIDKNIIEKEENTLFGFFSTHFHENTFTNQCPTFFK